MGSLDVSVAAGRSGPVLVLAGEADVTSVRRLADALATQASGQAVQLTIDATDLRYADSASIRALVMAAEKIRTGDGTVTLLNPQPPVARLLELLCVDDMISVKPRDAAEATSARYHPSGGGTPGGGRAKA